MLSKRYESTEVNRRTWLHVPSGTHWSTSNIFLKWEFYKKNQPCSWNTNEPHEINIVSDSSCKTFKERVPIGLRSQGYGVPIPVSTLQFQRYCNILLQSRDMTEISLKLKWHNKYIQFLVNQGIG